MNIFSKNFKKIISASLFLCLALFLMIPDLTFAKDSGNSSRNSGDGLNQEPINNSPSGYCINLNKHVSDVNQNISDYNKNNHDETENKIQKITESKQEVSQKLAITRDTWDKNYQERYKKILELATTSSQKQAVTDFKNSVTQAMQTERNSIDLAVKNFTDGLNTLAVSEQASASTTLSQAETTLQNSLAQAKTDCMNGTSQRKVEQEVSTAENAFKRTSRNISSTNIRIGQNSGSIQSQIAVLTKTRDAAIKQAQTTFQNTLLQAADALKHVLK